MLSKIGFLPCAILACLPAWADSDSTITVHYIERKPLHYRDEQGRLSGILVPLVEQSFAKAGIPMRWQLTPENRIMATLKANDGRDCSSGIYKSAERESFARISPPIYRDKGLVALARADYPVPAVTTAHELFTRPQARLLIKQGFVYGRYLDPMIEKMPPAQVQRVTDEIGSMVRMVRAGIADFIILTEEEGEVYADAAGAAAPDSIRLLHLSDVPAQEYRYIFCSKGVPQEVMDRLNAAIAVLQVDAPHHP
ncbi:MAG TPA: transporter substrate-binding domain-containing protein [Burkholderiaceae bacterium]